MTFNEYITEGMFSNKKRDVYVKFNNYEDKILSLVNSTLNSKSEYYKIFNDLVGLDDYEDYEKVIRNIMKINDFAKKMLELSNDNKEILNNFYKGKK